MQLEYQISISADLAALDLVVARINQIQATEEKSAALAEKSLRLAQAITSQRQTENDLLAKSHYLMQAGRTAEAIQAANLAEQVRQQRMLNEERQRQAAIRPAAPKEESFGSIIANGFTQFLPSAESLTFPGVVAKAVGAVSQLIDKAKEIKEMSDQLGVTASEFNNLRRGAEASGSSVAAYASTFKLLGQARRTAAEGDQAMRDTFVRFGVSLRDLQDPSLRTLDLLKRIGESAKDLKGPDQRLLDDLLGPGSDQVVKSLAGLGHKSDKEFDRAVEGINRLTRTAKSAWGDITTAGIIAMGGLANAIHTAGEELQHGGWQDIKNLFKLLVETRLTPSSGAWQRFVGRSAQNYNDNPDPLPSREQQVSEQKFEVFRHESRKLMEQHGAAAAAFDQAAGKADWEGKDDQARELRRQAEASRAAQQKALNQYGMSRSQWEALPPEQRGSGYVNYDQQGKARQPETPSLFKDLALDRAKVELDEKRRRLAFEMLTDEEKKTALGARLAELQLRANGEPDERRRIEAESEMEDVKKQLFDLNKRPPHDDRLGVSASALQRIGGFTGGLGGTDPTHVAQAGLAALQSGHRADAQNLFNLLRNGVVVTFK